jgi:hypothetical protein
MDGGIYPEDIVSYTQYNAFHEVTIILKVTQSLHLIN